MPGAQATAARTVHGEGAVTPFRSTAPEAIPRSAKVWVIREETAYVDHGRPDCRTLSLENWTRDAFEIAIVLMITLERTTLYTLSGLVLIVGKANDSIGSEK